MHSIRTSEQGFGLVEVLVAAGIVAIASTVIFVSVTDVRKKARDTQRMSDISQLQIALKMYNDVYGTYNIENIIPNGEGIVWVSTPPGDDTSKLPGDSGIDIIVPGDNADLGIDDKSDQIDTVSVDRALYEKGFLPVPQLNDPKPSGEDNNGYLFALCNEGRQYAIYAAKEIAQDQEIAHMQQLCESRHAVGQGMNYGVGN